MNGGDDDGSVVCLIEWVSKGHCVPGRKSQGACLALAWPLTHFFDLMVYLELREL